MGKLRKLVGVALAVAVVAAVVVYVLIPKTGTTTNNVVVTQPQNPTGGGSGTTPSGGSGSGGSDSGSGGSGSSPPPTVPPTRPPKLHGQNSHGPKHLICLPTKNHPGNGVSQYQGANQYRGLCPAGSSLGSQTHGQGHATDTTPNVAAVPTLFYAVPATGVYGIL